jgi:hypothetical protein
MSRSAGEAKYILGKLGLKLSGGIPQAAGDFAMARGEKHALLGGFLSLLTASLLRLPDKLELARLMTSLAQLDRQSARGVTDGHRCPHRRCHSHRQRAALPGTPG